MPILNIITIHAVALIRLKMLIHTTPRTTVEIIDSFSPQLIGLIRQGVRCKDCKYNAHRDCSKKIGDNCQGDMLYIFTNSGMSSMQLAHDYLSLSPNILHTF